MSNKSQRDATIKELFERFNLGPVSNTPFSDEVAEDLMNRISSRLMGYEKDLEDKKVISMFIVSTFKYRHTHTYT